MQSHEVVVFKGPAVFILSSISFSPSKKFDVLFKKFDVLFQKFDVLFLKSFILFRPSMIWFFRGIILRKKWMKEVDNRLEQFYRKEQYTN